MKCPPLATKPSTFSVTAGRAFTLIELLAVIAIIGTLAAILLPALAKARERSRATYCMNNTRQLALAWHLYADDHDGVLPYNIGMSGTFRTNLNWVNNVMSWDLSPDNTNPATITRAALGTYVVGVTAIFHCPSDNALSSLQAAAGWNARLRSYSMNAMVGNAGAFMLGGKNVNNPSYRQFLKLDQIPRPTDIFVFLDEHPNSIDDGYFVNKDLAAGPTGGYGASSVPVNQWNDLPASYHNRAAAFSFADGHASLHRWARASTVIPTLASAAYLPVQIPDSPAVEHADFEWVMDHMSIEN